MTQVLPMLTAAVGIFCPGIWQSANRGACGISVASSPHIFLSVLEMAFVLSVKHQPNFHWLELSLSLSLSACVRACMRACVHVPQIWKVHKFHRVEYSYEAQLR